MSEFENYGEGFYDSGYSQPGYDQNSGYDQSSYGYGSPQQGYYGGGYEQQGYDQSYSQQTYTPQPTMMNPNQYVNYNGDGRHASSQNEYASFDDEPPLLEGWYGWSFITLLL